MAVIRTVICVTASLGGLAFGRRWMMLGVIAVPTRLALRDRGIFCRFGVDVQILPAALKAEVASLGMSSHLTHGSSRRSEEKNKEDKARCW